MSTIRMMSVGRRGSRPRHGAGAALADLDRKESTKKKLST